MDYEHAGTIKIIKLKNSESLVQVIPDSSDTYVRTEEQKTNYPTSLIELIFKAKGITYLCDEIRRDEDRYYIEHHIATTLFSHIDPRDFEGKRLLDFGCGAGASTMALARNLPNTTIVGVELERDNLEIAKARAEFYGYSGMQFFQSPSGDTIPEGLGTFDFVVLSADYEHLFTEEQHLLLKQLWGLLKLGGILIIDETPHRWFPIETHTTGLPFINYLPKQIAHWYVRRATNRSLKEDSWEILLRKGLRGSTKNFILRQLKCQGAECNILKSLHPELKDPIDVWFEGYAKNESGRKGKAKRILYKPLKLFYQLTSIAFVPYISLAIQKSR